MNNQIDFQNTRLLRVSDLINILCLSRSMVYKLLSDGDIPSVRIRKSIRVNALDFSKYLSSLNRNTIPTSNTGEKV